MFKKSLKEGNLKEIGETAHRILPSFKHLEIEKTIPKLVELKTRTLVDNNPGKIDQLLIEIIDEIDKVIEDLSNEIKDLD